MKNKIRIYESEIKRAVRRKLMENYIDSMREEEQMTVYNQDEFDNKFKSLTKGTYGIKDQDGNIRSVTVNEEEDDEKWIPKDLKKGRSTRLTKGDKSIEAIDKKLRSYDTDTNKKGVQTKSDEDLSKVRALNLSKRFKRGI
jgi:hypothetical protein